jgi:hypothetical protein
VRWPAGRPPGAPKAAEPSPRDGDVDPSSTQTGSLAAGYEQLRERALSGQPDGWRLGHGVLVGKGMVAWANAWTTHALAQDATPGTSAPDQPTAPTTPSLSTPNPHPSALSSLPCAGQLVAVLTQMALAHA